MRRAECVVDGDFWGDRWREGEMACAWDAVLGGEGVGGSTVHSSWDG